MFTAIDALQAFKEWLPGLSLDTPTSVEFSGALHEWIWAGGGLEAVCERYDIFLKVALLGLVQLHDDPEYFNYVREGHATRVTVAPPDTTYWPTLMDRDYFEEAVYRRRNPSPSKESAPDGPAR